MLSLPPEARTQNRSKWGFCKWCRNTGLVVAQTRPVRPSVFMEQHGIRPAEPGAIEEMAPCPYCEKGWHQEFQAGAPWGPDGFWKGRTHAELTPETDEVALLPSVQRDKMRELGQQLGLLPREIP